MADEALGVDIGGVIISHQADANGIYQPLLAVFQVLKKLKQKRFGEKIFVVSHAGMEMECKMRLWLALEGFYSKTGISADNIHFCRQRIEKAEICLKLGITYFIDDRKEILTYLRAAQVKNLYLFQGRKEEDGKFMEVLPHVCQVKSWREIEKKLVG